MRRDQIAKTNENLTAHLFVPGQRILLRETTVTEIEKTWRIEIEQRSLYVLGLIPGLATYFRFSFRFFKKGSCQLLAKVCARSTG